MAGAMAGLVYSLHCPEIAYAFLAVWYVAAMAVMAAMLPARRAAGVDAAEVLREE